MISMILEETPLIDITGKNRNAPPVIAKNKGRNASNLMTFSFFIHNSFQRKILADARTL
jgi:hypothetical protein